jgi:hypothetical protein
MCEERPLTGFIIDRPLIFKKSYKNVWEKKIIREALKSFVCKNRFHIKHQRNT